jgi:Flp pilus assembly protein TadG
VRVISSPLNKNPSVRRRGSTLVEFALIFPVLIALLIGIMEFGVLVNYKLRLANATREGARYAAIGKDTDLIRSRVRQYAAPLLSNTATSTSTIYLQYESDRDAMTPDYDVTLGNSDGQNNCPRGNLIRVQVNTPHMPLTGFFPFLRNYILTSNVVMRRE